MDLSNTPAFLAIRELASVAPNGPIPHPPIKQTRASHLTRDQRRDIQLLYRIGWSYQQIRNTLPFYPTIRQVNYAYKETI